MNNNTMSIFAEALIDAKDYKKGKARISGDTVGVANFKMWRTAIINLLHPAYAIASYNHDHMGDAETVEPCDMSDFFKYLHVVIDMIGTVNGVKLDIANTATVIIPKAMKDKTIDLTEEMAHAHCERTIARKKKNADETPENVAEYEKWRDECIRLESLPGNCKTHATIVSKSVFINEVEHLFSEAITAQKAKTLDEIMAEEKAKEEKRKASKKAARSKKRRAEAEKKAE